MFAADAGEGAIVVAVWNCLEPGTGGGFVLQKITSRQQLPRRPPRLVDDRSPKGHE